MKRLLIIYFLLTLGGCATQYILPGNRFATPETQGGFLNNQFEFQQTPGNQLTADLSQGSVEDGVLTQQISRSGFAYATSLFDSFDFFWTHTGASLSLFGAKFQFLGGSKSSKATGNKMALSVATGGNSHEIEGSTQVKFELQGTEAQLLYGYRFSELVMLYSNLSYSSYNFNGEVISTDITINGLKPSYDTKIYAFYQGLEFDLWSFFGKVECGYQQIQTSNTKDEAHFIYGYSMGFVF